MTGSEPAGGDIVIAKVRAWLRVIRTEERVLLATWLVGYLVAYRSNTGFDIGPVFMLYLGFFGIYVLYLVLVTRLAFWWSETRQPTWSLARRLHCWLFGPAADDELDRLDRAFVGNGPALQERTKASVLAMDVEFVRGVFLLFANLTLYSNIKTRIPFINSSLGDAWYQKVDHAIFGKGFITSIEQWFANNPGVADYFAHVYKHDYVWMIVLALVLYLRRDTFSFRWLMISVCITYIVCVLVSAAYPSFGPVYMDPERFAWLKGSPIGRLQGGLAFFYDRSITTVTAGRDFHADAFAGIAAFPSLHVGHMVILLVVALRTVPAYALWLGWVTIATSIATVGFGWHYLIDAVGGILIAAAVTEGVYRLMCRAAARATRQ